MYLEEKIHEINSILSILEGEPVAVWCLGKHTEKFMEHTDILNCNIRFFIDKKADCHPVKKAYGKPLYSPDEADLDSVACIVISSYRFQNEIQEDIVNRGYKGKIVLLYTEADEGEFYLLPDKKNESYYFTGDYMTWEEAEKDSSGYEEQSILDKVLNSTKLVISGEACFERDSVAFYYRDYNFRLVSIFGLLARKKSSIGILDFGGALGSEYWKNREILHQFGVEFSWNIVEQEHYVEMGNKQVANNELHFYKTIEEIKTEIDFVLISSVLQYIEEYETVIEQVLKLHPQHIMIDLQPVSNENRICVQHVGKNIYEASYPLRIIAEKNLLKFFDKEYDLQIALDVGGENNLLCVDGKKFQYMCYWFKRREKNMKKLNAL